MLKKHGKEHFDTEARISHLKCTVPLTNIDPFRKFPGDAQRRDYTLLERQQHVIKKVHFCSASDANSRPYFYNVIRCQHTLFEGFGRPKSQQRLKTTFIIYQAPFIYGS